MDIEDVAGGIGFLFVRSRPFATACNPELILAHPAPVRMLADGAFVTCGTVEPLDGCCSVDRYRRCWHISTRSWWDRNDHSPRPRTRKGTWPQAFLSYPAAACNSRFSLRRLSRPRAARARSTS